MSDYGTKLAEGFAQKVVELYYANSIAPDITNSDYEGEVKDKNSKLNILTFGKVQLHDYTGAAMSADDPQESVGTLITDQAKDYYFKIKSLDKFHSWIKNPEGTLLDSAGKSLKETIDSYILGFYTKAAAGQRIGTDYTAGTVDIDVNGVVTGTSTTFTADMVGRGFKAVGHSKWYRVKSYTSATSITIENDSDDETSSYDGGVISGANYTIEAATPVTVTKDTIYGYLVELQGILDDAKIPATDRWIVVPTKVKALLQKAPELTPAVPTAYEDVVKKGIIGEIAGFRVYSSPFVSGDNTNGYHILAGHKSAITFANAFTESGIEDLIGNFGKAYKGLDIYGAKVVDERRKALAELFCKV